MPKHSFLRRSKPLHKCLWCGSKYVSLVEMEHADETHWRVLLRCGECGVWCDETVGLSAMDAFDRELDRAADVIASELLRLDQERMAEAQ